MASDEKRLELFNEVTGSLIWQEKLPEMIQKLRGNDISNLPGFFHLRWLLI